MATEILCSPVSSEHHFQRLCLSSKLRPHYAHRMSYDPPTRRIFAGDVGEARWEEIDAIERGANYQWNYREADEPYQAPPARIVGVERGPLHAFAHKRFAAVIAIPRSRPACICARVPINEPNPT